MGCSSKQRGVMKKAMKSSKKDGKGGPMGDAVKGIAQKASDTVKTVGDTKIKDAVAGVGRAMTFPGRAVKHSAKDVVRAVGTEWAKTRGQGEKKGLLKQAVQKSMPAKGPLRDLPKIPRQMPKLPTQMPLPGKGEIRPLIPKIPNPKMPEFRNTLPKINPRTKPRIEPRKRYA